MGILFFFFEITVGTEQVFIVDQLQNGWTDLMGQGGAS